MFGTSGLLLRGEPLLLQLVLGLSVGPAEAWIGSNEEAPRPPARVNACGSDPRLPIVFGQPERADMGPLTEFLAAAMGFSILASGALVPSGARSTGALLTRLGSDDIRLGVEIK